MRVYIAGQMSGLPDWNYHAFYAAAEQLEAAGYDPINPARSEGREGCSSWLDFMRAALRDVADADGVAALPGWWDSRGAAIEVQLAHSLGLPAVSVDEWVARATARRGA